MKEANNAPAICLINAESYLYQSSLDLHIYVIYRINFNCVSNTLKYCSTKIDNKKMVSLWRTNFRAHN